MNMSPCKIKKVKWLWVLPPLLCLTKKKKKTRHEKKKNKKITFTTNISTCRECGDSGWGQK